MCDVMFWLVWGMIHLSIVCTMKFKVKNCTQQRERENGGG